MVKIEDEDEATARIEAALYSAGRPLIIEELIKASGTESRTKTLNILNNIMKKSKSAFKAIEIAILPDGSYVFQLKPEYSATIRRYASKPILHKATLKTLSYIAYLQPISSKQLVEACFNRINFFMFFSQVHKKIVCSNILITLKMGKGQIIIYFFLFISHEIAADLFYITMLWFELNILDMLKNFRD